MVKSSESEVKALKGQAPDNMKVYIDEVHIPLIQTFQLAMKLSDDTEKYVNGYLEEEQQHKYCNFII